MAFDFTTLITDRTAADAAAVKTMSEKIRNGTATTEEVAAYVSASMKGAYNAVDLNRVTEACEYLAARFRQYGYPVTVRRPKIRQVITTPSRLPEGFIELTYIESTGTQYIDTEFKPNQDTRVVADCQFDSTPSSDAAVFGVRNANVGQFWAYYRPPANAFSFRYANSSTNNLAAATPTVRNILDANKNVFVAGANSVTATSSSFSASYPIYLFAVNNAGTVQYSASVKIYSCQVYDNGVLARSFIPCINADGEVGLYDLVTEAFFGNSGTGAFVGGPLMALPDGYTQVDYIQSSGMQYIDTGFKHNQNTRIVMDAQVVTQPSTHAWLIGGRTSAASGAKSLFLLSGTSWRSDYNAASARATVSGVGITDRLSIDFNKNALKVNAFTQTWTATTFQSNASLSLLADNENGTISGYISAKIFSCQIYDNDNLVRDYVPCINSDGTAGLLDMVEGVFYLNAGTGTFAVGEVVDIPEGGGGSTTIERDYWEIGDIPTTEAMDIYLQNVRSLRAAYDVGASIPAVPAEMEGLTVTEANNIEVILVSLDYMIAQMLLSRLYAGEIYGGEF